MKVLLLILSMVLLSACGKSQATLDAEAHTAYLKQLNDRYDRMAATDKKLDAMADADQAKAKKEKEKEKEKAVTQAKPSAASGLEK
ncbi:hypothetical protein LPN04_31485 [Rugamonas sp. A1-17]|nr:hypothetical protein [Rugamonas sp. A1-17]